MNIFPVGRPILGRGVRSVRYWYQYVSGATTEVASTVVAVAYPEIGEHLGRFQLSAVIFYDRFYDLLSDLTFSFHCIVLIAVLAYQRASCDETDDVRCCVLQSELRQHAGSTSAVIEKTEQ